MMIGKNKDLFIIFTLLFAFIVSFFSDGSGIFRVIFGFLFVLFLPGYSFTSVLFPYNSYNNIERIVLSCGLSIALSPMLGFLMLKLLGHAYILVCLGFFIVFFSLFAYFKRLKNERVEASSKSDEVTSRETLSKKIIFISMASSVLMVVIACYFKIFPIVGNILISDILITILIFTLSLLLVFGAFLVKTYREAYFILPTCLMFTFIARSVMYLRLLYPPLWDPYAFLVAFLNIHTFQTLEPVLTMWLPQLEGILPWPLMLLITENLVLATGLHYTYFFKFQEPLLGTLFFLAIFILAKEITKNYGIALMASLFSSSASHVIFYQSEYHAQGLVFVLLAFLIYSIMKSLNCKHTVTYRIIALVFVPAIVLSHYFSSLFLAIIFVTILFAMNSLAVLERRVKEGVHRIIGDTSHNALFLAIAIFSIFYHFYSYSKHLEGYIKAVLTTPYSYRAEIISFREPFPTNIIKNMRMVLLILAFVSVTYIWRTRNRKEFYLATFWLSYIIFGLIGNFFIWLEVGRIVSFYETVTGIFGAITLFRFRDEWVKSVSRNKKTIMAVLSASAIITCSFFGGTYVPAYYFKSFGIDEHYWCSNRLPNMDAYAPAGGWIKTYTPLNAKYVTDVDRYGFTCSLVFFFGGKSSENLIKTNEPVAEALKLFRQLASEHHTYVVIIEAYQYQKFDDFLNFSSLIYISGEVGVYMKGK